jgi:hypothetical protein
MLQCLLPYSTDRLLACLGCTDQVLICPACPTPPALPHLPAETFQPAFLRGVEARVTIKMTELFAFDLPEVGGHLLETGLNQ